jgi:hypothetical protein
MSSLLCQRVLGQYRYTIDLLYAKTCPADCSSWELRLRLPLQDLDIGRATYVSVAPGGVLLPMSKFARCHHTVGYAPGTLGLGLAQILFSA